MDITKTLGLKLNQQGKDGTSVYTMDLSNEMDGVSVDSLNRVTEDTVLTTTVKLYYGEYDLKILSEPVISGVQKGITYYTDYEELARSVNITFEVPAGTVLRDQYIEIKAESGKGILSKVFNVKVFHAGADGKPGTVYFLQPSVDVIKVDKDNKYSVTSVTCKQYERVGSQAAVESNFTIKYSEDGGEEKNYTGEILVGDLLQSIKFSLYREQELLDTETVPIIKDGKDSSFVEVKPGVPVISVKAYKDFISLNAIIDNSGNSNSVKKVIWEISNDNFNENVLRITSPSAAYNYYFQRENDILGYPEKNVNGYLVKLDGSEWKVKAKVINNNVENNEGDFCSPVNIACDNSYLSWLPTRPVVENIFAEKDGFNIKWKDSGASFLDNNYKVTVLYDDEELFSVSDLDTPQYDYIFRRDVDGYPEKSNTVVRNVKVINRYSVIITSYNKIYNFDSEKKAVSDKTNVSDEHYDTWIPAPVTTGSPIAEKDGFEIYWNFVKNFGNSKFKVSILYDDVEQYSYETDSLVYFYNFNRDIDGFPEVNTPEGTNIRELSRYSVVIIHYNEVYDASVNIGNVTIRGLNTSVYKGWLPKPVSFTGDLIATKNGINLNWESKDSYEPSLFKIIAEYLTDESYTELRNISIPGSKTYEYLFNRDIDGYPEKEEVEGYPAKGLNKYRFKVVHYNSLYPIGSGSETSALKAVSTYGYGTWKISELVKNNISIDVVDRTAMLKLSIPTTNLEYYGRTEFHISIQRPTQTIPEIVIDGVVTEPEEIVSGDVEWYQPNLNGSYFTDVDSYKGDVGYFVSNERFTQTLPLLGQDKNKIINTEYDYKIVAVNESGASTVPYVIKIIALCTSIRDVVKAHADFKKLYVEELSALSVNVGLLQQGGFGSFDKWKNFWALSTMDSSDVGTDRPIKEGAFRVGGDNEYIAVVPPHSTFGVEGTDTYIDNSENDDFLVKIKAGNIELTTNGSSFKGGTYVYDSSDNSKRMKLSNNGINIQSFINDKWEEQGNVTIDNNGNLMITNSDFNSDTLPKYGIFVGTDAKVYHLDENLKDENNNNPLIGSSDGKFIESPFAPNYRNAYSGKLTVPTDGNLCFFMNGIIRVNDTTVVGINSEGQGYLDNTLVDWERMLNVSQQFKWEE